MPEGDTIWRTARALHAALAGKTVLAFASSLPAAEVAARKRGLVGRTVEAVEARGKHLLFRFSGGPVLHTHQGMRGAWRLPRAPPARVDVSRRLTLPCVWSSGRTRSSGRFREGPCRSTSTNVITSRKS